MQKKIKKIIISVLILAVFAVSHSAFAITGDNTVETATATNITDTTATLNGNADATSGTYWFQYTAKNTSPINNSGNWVGNSLITTHTSINSTNLDMSKDVTGLSASTKYFYRFCVDEASSSGHQTSCGSVISFFTTATPANTANNCAVTSFTASSTTITLGQSTTLSWVSKNCTSASIAEMSNNTTSQVGVINSPSIPAGSYVVTPAVTEIYYLTAYDNSANSGVKMVTVTVNAPTQTQTGASNVLTGGYTNVTDTTATLSGSANPEGVSTSGYFRYSAVAPGNVSPLFCNEIYGSDMMATNEVQLGSGTSSVIFKKNLTGLLPSTTYFYCAIASNKNKNGIAYGTPVNNFITNEAGDITPNSSSAVTTQPALVVDSTSAYLNGSFNISSNFSTWFEYMQKATNSNPSGASISNNSSSVVNDSGTPTISNTTPTGVYSWKKVNLTSQSATTSTSGTMDFLLTGLSPNTTYVFRAAIKDSSGNITYGSVLTFQTQDSSNIIPGVVPNNNIIINGGTNGYNNNGTSNNTPATPHTLGETVTAPTLDVVRQGEGIETVFARQIVNDSDLAEEYGYTEGKDLQAFAWNLADVLARSFGYVNSKGKQIRVSKPDVAAYELQLTNGELTVYEYYNSKIVNIEKLSSSVRSKYFYEYYYSKK